MRVSCVVQRYIRCNVSLGVDDKFPVSRTLVPFAIHRVFFFVAAVSFFFLSVFSLFPWFCFFFCCRLVFVCLYHLLFCFSPDDLDDLVCVRYEEGFFPSLSRLNNARYQTQLVLGRRLEQCHLQLCASPSQPFLVLPPGQLLLQHGQASTSRTWPTQ